MRKLTLIVAAACLATAGYAQKSKISSAKNMLILQRYDEAKKTIDEAIANEKTVGFAGTYTVAADIYGKMAATGKNAQGIAEAKQFLEKAMDIDAKGDAKGKGIGKFKKDIKESCNTLSGNAEQTAINNWKDKDYRSAMNNFFVVLWANEKKVDQYDMVSDSLIFYNLATAAWLCEEYQTSADYFEKSYEAKYEPQKSLIFASQCYEKMNLNDKREATLKKGFENYPDDKEILNNLINYYITAEKNSEALAYLNAAIEKDPANPQFYYARAYLNEKLDPNNAIADYEKAISMDDKYFNAIVRLGELFIEIGNKYKSDATADSKISQAKYDELMNGAKDQYKKSISYLERSIDLTESNEIKKLIYTDLKSLYYQIGDYTKSQEMADKANAL
jgi:tetratricopeptide (TPR) repeat protein